MHAARHVAGHAHELLAHHCRDFSRTEALRAAAGRGLPVVEPGMPAPAGSGLSRRALLLPAVGYDHPDQSHFVSRHFYEVGALDPRLATGWLGRYLDRVGAADNPLQGNSLD